MWWTDITTHWSAVVVDLSERHSLDLWDPAVLARPWPGICLMILDLVDSPSSRLAIALSKEA